MTSVPRPKPWEKAVPAPTVAAGSTSKIPSTSTSTSSAFDTALQASNNLSHSSVSSTSNTAPKLPERPAGLADGNGIAGPSNSLSYQQRYSSSYMSPYGGMGAGSLGSVGGLGGGYGAYGGYGGYGGMNRFGGGGYGGYGYGMGGYGVGGMGGPGEGFPTLTSSLQASTAPAFAVLESLVGAITSLAQLVESTYMATHSSFFAMVGVADQLGSLKSYLGQVLGVFSLLRLGRRILAWLRGKRRDVDAATGLGLGRGWANEWSGAAGGLSQAIPGQTPSVPGAAGPAGRPSAKPLLLFLLSAIGLPYLMTRLVNLLIAHQQQQQLQNGNGNGLDADGKLDLSKIEFARAKWEFKPGAEWELGLGRDEIVAVLEKRAGAAGQGGGGEQVGWWRGRTRDGRVGWFPGNYVEIIRRREPSQ